MIREWGAMIQQTEPERRPEPLHTDEDQLDVHLAEVAARRSQRAREMYDSISAELLDSLRSSRDDPKRVNLLSHVAETTGYSAAEVQTVMWMLRTARKIESDYSGEFRVAE